MPDHSETLPAPPRLYGVWLSPGNPNGEGWLRGPAPECECFGTLDYKLAQQTATWFGGKVMITDLEYTAFEAQMLWAERERKHGLFGKRRKGG